MKKSKVSVTKQGEKKVFEEVVDMVFSSWENARNRNNSLYLDFDNLLTKFKGVLTRKLEIILQERNFKIKSNLQQIGKNKNRAIWVNLNMDNQEYDGYNFDDAIFVNLSSRHTKFKNCRFRNTIFLFCDLRYIEVNGGTFEAAQFWWCDLYRAYFQGVVRFAHSIIENTSLNNTYFAGGALIRKENFYNSKLLQEDRMAYRDFLVLWDSIREKNDKIKNNNNLTGDEKINEILKNRSLSLELIYKSLSSCFCANGFSNDSNWAYVKGKRSERAVLINKLSWSDFFSRNIFSQLRFIGEIAINRLYDIAFGYGESLKKIILTYCFIVLFFTFVYIYEANIEGFVQAFIISFKNMSGISSPELENQNLIVSLLNLIQTTIGIIITGIFGFILGNRIRNQ